jgi:hypothetical protein
VNVVKQLAPSVDFAKMNFMTGTTATVRAKLLCLCCFAVTRWRLNSTEVCLRFLMSSGLARAVSAVGSFVDHCA